MDYFRLAYKRLKYICAKVKESINCKNKNKISNFIPKMGLMDIVLKFCNNSGTVLPPKGIIGRGDVLKKSTAFSIINY